MGDPTSKWRARECKADALGRVECLVAGDRRLARRLAVGCRWPGSRLVARCLLRRERRALAALTGLAGVPQLVDDASARLAVDARGQVPAARDVLVRSWLEGEPLWQAAVLPADFFVQLRILVAAMHARGVCHNDLHKENNILVGPGGWPALVDFQLASVHRGRGAGFRRRCAEDLRHVDKHAARYARAGQEQGAELPPRGLLARCWRWTGKPLYNLLVRRLWRAARRGEPRRPKAGPWPAVAPPLTSDRGDAPSRQRAPTGL